MQLFFIFRRIINAFSINAIERVVIILFDNFIYETFTINSAFSSKIMNYLIYNIWTRGIQNMVFTGLVDGRSIT